MRAAKGATTVLPIVFGSGDDPVAAGLVTSLSRPGGNITGVSVDTGPAIHGKRIELLREVFPGLSKLAFVTARVVWEAVQGAAMTKAAAATGVPVTLATVIRDGDRSEPVLTELINDAAAAMRLEGVEAEARVLQGAPAETLIALLEIANASSPSGSRQPVH